MSVLLETSYGDIVVDLYQQEAPTACLNFVKLCKIKYYNDCEFFRIEKGFIAQTGDPSNTGHGGASIFAACTPPGPKFFRSKRSAHIKHARKGTVSMAASDAALIEDKKGHGSQFFITLADGLNYLDAEHTAFGYVAEGMDVVDRIADTFVDKSFQPFRLIRIRHTIVLHDPFDDPEGIPTDCRSPEPAQGGRGDRLGSDEEENVTDADHEEKKNRLQQVEEEREARSRAEVLEMIGDIPDADMKPPDNVLFICKLNPITEAEDLEIIFSRFGECKADILRDKSTSASLCYGFIQFEDKKQCEKAYFKMDNALIDDRRIHVDFSQSVSKLWNATQQAKTSKRTHLQNLAPAKRLRSEGGHTKSSNDIETTIDAKQKPLQSNPARKPKTTHSFEQASKTIADFPGDVRNRRRSRFDVRPSQQL